MHLHEKMCKWATLPANHWCLVLRALQVQVQDPRPHVASDALWLCSLSSTKHNENAESELIARVGIKSVKVVGNGECRWQRGEGNMVDLRSPAEWLQGLEKCCKLNLIQKHFDQILVIKMTLVAAIFTPLLLQIDNYQQLIPKSRCYPKL